MFRMADLQGPENSDVSLTQHRSANLKNGIHISTYYYVFLHIIITVRRRSKRPMSSGSSMACTSNRLRSEDSGGSARLIESSSLNSWRKLAI